jgi:glycosyltransferase involved in cell wall biosynthesis
MPKVSVIIPCLNEAKFIGPCLDSVLSGEFPADDLEILVVDGNSEDGTGPIVDQYAARHPRVRRLANPRRNTPSALNIGLAHATGDVIVRLDAHALYPPGYIARLVDWLERSGADNVGGIWETMPAGTDRICRAIAVALSYPFGVGNSYFRIGSREPRWVETVPFGCYRREVFERIGVFDEELLRNQDDEFNYRLLKHGGRILLVPEIVSRYYARDSYQKLWRMYFQYGLFKPLVIAKIGAVVRVRHAIPALLVGSIGTGLLLGLWMRPFLAVSAALVALYILATLFAAAAAVRKDRAATPALLPWLCAAFATIHWAYGAGFICGIYKVAARRWRSGTPAAQWIQISR